MPNANDVNVEVSVDQSTNVVPPIYVESWYQRSWRPMMAYLYLFLCFLDYGVRPAVNYYLFKQFNLVQVVSTIKELDPTVQVQIIEVLRHDEAIEPILSEFVHLAFGAILGAAAFTRGQEKGTRIKESGPYLIASPKQSKTQVADQIAEQQAALEAQAPSDESGEGEEADSEDTQGQPGTVG